jgi:hypothetical protein
MDSGVKSSLSPKESVDSESSSPKPFENQKGHILTVYVANLFAHPRGEGTESFAGQHECAQHDVQVAPQLLMVQVGINGVVTGRGIEEGFFHE